MDGFFVSGDAAACGIAEKQKAGSASGFLLFKSGSMSVRVAGA
jgi:hypothetical protein